MYVTDRDKGPEPTRLENEMAQGAVNKQKKMNLLL